MDWLTSIITWLLTGSIYGIALLAVGAYGLAKLMKFPVPEAAGVVVFLIGMFTLPSYPRYTFEKDTYAELAKHPEYRIVQTTHWGSLTEPVTWIHSFTGHFRAVAPDPISSDEELHMSTFRQIVFRYDEKPQEWMINVFCKDNKISSALRDENGKFELLSKDWEPISNNDRRLLCESNWKKETDHAWKHLVRLDSNPELCVYPFGPNNGLLMGKRIAC